MMILTCEDIEKVDAPSPNGTRMYLSEVGFTLVGVISEEGGGSNPPVLAIADGLCRLGHRVLLIGDERSAQVATDRGIEAIVTSDRSGLRDYFGPAHFGGWARRLLDGDDLADAAMTETVQRISDRLRNQDSVGKACRILTDAVQS